MNTIQFSGIVTKDVLDMMSGDPVQLLKRNIAARILAKESGVDVSFTMTLVDLEAPIDERIVWTETTNEAGMTITGTLGLVS